jgi:hypothetical protein
MRLGVIMVRTSQSGQVDKSHAPCAGAAPPYESDVALNVALTLHDRDNGIRAGTRTDDTKSKSAKASEN